ncbi:MAG TPA: zf-TFIIB domain-containing protein [Gaiellaceae bacterium]|nr:zf-TFIIB domain-containing protein [Gaiellaceae bacterium]
MNCPVCETAELALAERERVEIDYCPRCRGVWLDRGELDKVIERFDGEPRRDRDRDRDRNRDRDRDDDRDEDGYRSRRGGRRRRNRESMLGDLFEFGG